DPREARKEAEPLTGPARIAREVAREVREPERRGVSGQPVTRPPWPPEAHRVVGEEHRRRREPAEAETDERAAIEREREEERREEQHVHRPHEDRDAEGEARPVGP